MLMTGHAVQIEPGLQRQSPKNGIFQISAADYQQFRAGSDQIGPHRLQGNELRLTAHWSEDFEQVLRII